MGSTIQSAMKKLGVELVQATATKDGVAGVRVWRLPDDEPAREDTDPEPQQNEIPGKRGRRK
jgi:hypothetical protein